MKYTFILLLITLFCLKLEAQDPRFAQFYAAPDQLNPALTVVYEGRMRFIANYRDQWSSVLNDVPFRTVAAHLDYRFNIAGNDYLAIGVNGMKDQAGTSRLNRVNGNLNMGFMKYLGGGRKKSYYLVAGAQLGLRQHSVDWSDLWFSQQFDISNEIVDFNLPSGETENRKSPLAPDFSAGVLWYTISGDNSFYVGGAMYHINSPNLSIFDGGNDPLERRIVGHLGGELVLDDHISLLPAAAIYIQGPATDFNIGANLRYSSNENDELALRIGGWAHVVNKEENSYSFEAFTVTAMLEMQSWMLGLSYDINTSELTPASNSRGAFEASFIYLLPEKQRRVKVRCPKF